MSARSDTHPQLERPYRRDVDRFVCFHRGCPARVTRLPALDYHPRSRLDRALTWMDRHFWRCFVTISLFGGGVVLPALYWAMGWIKSGT